MKKWINHWVCDPVFASLQTINLYHKQFAESPAKDIKQEEYKNRHTLFRQRFCVPVDASKVTLDITADDEYKLYINGMFVAQGPGSAYHFHYPYSQLDITPFVKEGENIIAVHVYYHGLVSRSFTSADYRQGLIAEIESDGRQLLTDQWKCAPALEYGYQRVIGYETQFDERIDNRVKKYGWKLYDFDDSNWEYAAVKEDDDHVLVPRDIPELQREERYPVAVKQLENGMILDFGTDLTGTLYLKASGKPGAKILIQYGEELESEDQVMWRMRCLCKCEDALILAEGENELETFEYKCFRYVQLVLEHGVTVSDIRVDYRHYPFDEAYCTYHSEDPLVNQIWEICKMAVKNCAQEYFLDCPLREKGAYLGDMAISAHAMYYLTGDTKLFLKCLRDFARTTRICKGMMGLATGSLMQEVADYSLLYPYQLLLYYQFTKDLEVLRELLPAAESVEAYFDGFRADNGLIEKVSDKWNIVDWPKNLRDGYDFVLANPIGEGFHNVINAHYVGMKICMEKIKDLLNVPYVKESVWLKEAFQKAFYCEETGLFVDAVGSQHSSVHANAFACFYGLQPEGHQLVPFIREKGLCCGVYPAYFLLYALLRIGEKQMVYELITNKSERSWYQMLQEGATSAFEEWSTEQKDGCSLCHAWSAAPIPLLMEMEQDVSWF